MKITVTHYLLALLGLLVAKFIAANELYLEDEEDDFGADPVMVSYF